MLSQKGEEALESEKEKNKERDSRLEALEQKFRPEELVRRCFISNFKKKKKKGPPRGKRTRLQLDKERKRCSPPG